MPPASNMRKSSTQTMTVGEPHPNSLLQAATKNSSIQPRRTARANTNRPANYYARPFGSISTAADHDHDMTDLSNSRPAGFYPALQYFTDAITALPKEVMKQFTLMKEVEAKVYRPNEQLGELIDSLMELPVPTRRQLPSSGVGPSAAQGLLTLTANNSISGSASASLVNGQAGRYSAQPSVVGSTNGEEAAETDSDRTRRQQFYEMRMLAHSLLANLDEKNVVLSEANRVLAQQEMRLDSVMPHIDNEISEEARLGSMAHWAYSDNRQKTRNPASAAQNRRDVAATNNLAAAANMLHENEIAQARKEAGREARGEKTKGKRVEHPGDSDFDDKPRKGPKGAKAKVAAGLGIHTNGEPANKRKKVADKAMGAPGMERTISSSGKGSKAIRDTPRSTPAAEPAIKKGPRAKPIPTLSKKKQAGSSHNSPMLASSPLASSFNPSSMMEPPSNARPLGGRLRQNSTATNLRHERVLDDDNETRPNSANGKINGKLEKIIGRRRVQPTTEKEDENALDDQTGKQLQEASERLKHEHLDMPDAGTEERLANSRSDSNSRKDSDRHSQVGTPRTESFQAGELAMSRSRTTRSKPNTRDDSSSAEPQSMPPGRGKHSRTTSNSHLVKQLAPFNKSPNLDRHRSRDDMDEDLDSLNDDDENINAQLDDTEPNVGEELASEREIRRSSTRRPISRRNTVNSNIRSSPAPMSRDSSPPASPPPSARGQGRAAAALREAMMHRESETAEVDIQAAEEEEEEEGEEGEEDESEHDLDDPNEPKYCYCDRGSFGEMVACDNENCPREWFHLECTELREAPSEEVKWYCQDCRPLFGSKVGRKGKAGRGRGG